MKSSHTLHATFVAPCQLPSKLLLPLSNYILRLSHLSLVPFLVLLKLCVCQFHSDMCALFAIPLVTLQTIILHNKLNCSVSCRKERRKKKLIDRAMSFPLHELLHSITYCTNVSMRCNRIRFNLFSLESIFLSFLSSLLDRKRRKVFH